MKKLHISQQESLLTLLYTDTPAAALIRNVLKAELFEGEYYEMAAAAFAYYDAYRKAPQSHAEELFAERLQSGMISQSKQHRIYEILRMIRASAPGLNREFIINNLNQFIRKQSLKKAFIEVGTLLQTQGDEAAQLEKAERIMLDAFKVKTEVDHGFRFSDKDSLKILFEEPEEIFPTGIKELDTCGIGPQRKTLLGYVAPKKSGKTWFMIHLAKHALMAQYKVLHVSLEMSERQIAQRYLQSLFAIPKREDNFSRTSIEYDGTGHFKRFNTLSVAEQVTMLDPRIQEHVKDQISKFSPTLDNLLIKEFSPNSLNINQLETLLDLLDQQERFVPDLLIVDYPRLMVISTERIREELGQTYIGLRRIASERNMAVAVPAQANREGVASRKVRSTHVAEDISLTHTADTVLTYSQTEPEYEAGLARLFVDDARNEASKITLVLTQHYSTGQFCLESTRLDTHTGDLLQGFLNDLGAYNSEQDGVPKPGEAAGIPDMI